ncbi:MAG: hypothetical protein ACRDFS_03265 [Chloroflexota bacterium]
MHLKPRSLGVLLAGLLVASTAGQALAANSLARAALKRSDAPAGFGQSHLKLYHHFVSNMTVMTKVGPVTQPASCPLPASLSDDGWRSGMIQVFDSPKSDWTLEACGSSFAGQKDARRAYKMLKTSLVRAPIATGLAKHLGGKVGDQADASVRSAKSCVCVHVPDLRLYQLVYRQGDVVLSVAYGGPDRFSPADFFRMVRRADHRMA